jgi:hypothetical protein
MFHRVLVEEWQRILTLISFTLFFSVFLLNLIRVLRMPKSEVHRLGSMPLDHASSPESHHASNASSTL